MTTSDTVHATIVPAPDVLFQNLGGEGVALNLASGAYYGFDEVATRMWTLVTEHGAVPQALDVLVAEYAVERPQLARDLDAFVAQLVNDGLLAISH